MSTHFHKFIPEQTKLLHTIHHRVNHRPFVIHLLDNDETYQTAILSFTDKKDAINIANVLEHHKREKGYYPNNMFTYEKPLEITFEPDEPFSLNKEPEEMYIQSTKEDDMFQYCAMNMLELMILSDLKGDPRMRLMNFELPVETVKELFEKTLQ